MRPEGITNEVCSLLFVEKGTVIFATRDFKPWSFREILKLHGLFGVERFLPPSLHVGGWGRFIRASLPAGIARTN